MIDIVFVILHYNAIHETQELIFSIKHKIDTQKYVIIIIDNHSPNKSGKILMREYVHDAKVVVISTEENLGFANGNNLGIKYCRKHFNPKFICCLNNDTLLTQNDFLHRIEQEYSRSHAAVIGPKIYVENGSLQKSAYNLKSLEEYKTTLSILQGVQDEYKPTTPYQIFKNILRVKFPSAFYLLKSIVGKESWQQRLRLQFRKEDVVLHGCCLIFTPVFFQHLEGFNRKTFLYVEEELLYLSLKKHNLLSVYNPSIKIRHMEDVATDSIVKTEEEKRKFLRKHQIASLKILIDEMEHGDQS